VQEGDLGSAGLSGLNASTALVDSFCHFSVTIFVSHFEIRVRASQRSAGMTDKKDGEALRRDS